MAITKKEINIWYIGGFQSNGNLPDFSKPPPALKMYVCVYIYVIHMITTLYSEAVAVQPL
jgi:hypothetical protein